MKRKRSLLLACFVIGAMVVFPSCGQEAPEPVKAGKFLNQQGVYSSPNGTHMVRIEEASEGRLNYSFLKGTFSPERTGGGPADPFPADSNWFLCFDDQDRLWAYVPGNGVHCYYETEEASGTMRPGEGGGWDGVPDEFFERLPPEIKATRRGMDQPTPEE